MKNFVVFLFLLMFPTFEMKAEVDPKFQIYLCFGQSNMSGGSAAEAVDLEYVDKRFQMLATDATYTDPDRVMGKWYTAYPPIVSGGKKICPADYFGRSMVAALPADYRVGVVAVAAGGVDIRVFLPETGKSYILYPQNPKMSKYNCDFYGRLVEMAKIAQKSGVIKGILMHQGEANAGQEEWPNWVKQIYDRLIKDLRLNAKEVPLLAGEVVSKADGGTHWRHNAVIAKLPTVIPTAHVISSAGCPGNIHFTALGYRILGKRYATKMLELLGYPAHKDANYKLPEGLRKFYKATRIDTYKDIDLLPGKKYKFNVTAYFEDGHKEDVTSEAVVTSTGNGLTINGTQLTAVTGERSLVTVSYTDFTGETVSTSFYVNKSASKGIILKAKNYSREYGEPNPIFDYSSEGDNFKGVPKVYCEATATSPVGTYPIKVSKGSITNGDIEFIDGTLTITKAPLTIMANSYTRVEGEPNPSFGVTYSGFKNGETDAVLTRSPIVTTTATIDSEFGTYDIEVSGAKAKNYTFNYIKGTLTITERKVPFTMGGITYEGLRSSSTAEVVSFDQSEDSLTILETIYDNGMVYRVTSIGKLAFYKCTDIMSVTLPGSVTSINSSAFEDCSSLTSVSLGEGLTFIGDSAFENCVMLPSITIPKSVTFIAPNAFKNCLGLKYVISEIEIPFEITSDVFYSISSQAELDVPDGTKTVYQMTAGWDVFSNISEVSNVGMDNILYFAENTREITIYSLNGQLVRRTTQESLSDVWLHLPKGVYIVNGNIRIK